MKQSCFRLAIFLVMAAPLWSAENPSPSTNKVLPVPGEVFSVEGYTAFLILPTKSPLRQPTPWVWYAPTLPGLPASEEKWMFEKFLAAGIGIAGIDVGESYGSPAGRELFSALYRELTEKRALSKKPCLLARSRGGLMLYSWACENATNVNCIAGIYPVCNPASYPGLEKASGTYGLTVEALKEQLPKYNPIERLQSLAEAGVPIFHIHGDSDKIVPLEANSKALADRYKELHGRMTLVIPPGQGHNMWAGFFQCRQLVDFVISHANNTALQPEPRDEKWMKQHESYVARTKEGDVDLLFLGDSITYGWTVSGKTVWDRYYGPRHAADFGIPSDYIQHMLWRIQHGELVGIKPKVLVLLAGVNNVTSDPKQPRNTPPEIVEGVANLIEEIRSRLPNTKILLLGLFPFREKEHPVRGTVREINVGLANLADGNAVQFLNFGEKFLAPDGTLSREIMPDLLHPSAKGYQIWAEAMEPTLAHMLEPAKN